MNDDKQTEETSFDQHFKTLKKVVDEEDNVYCIAFGMGAGSVFGFACGFVFGFAVCVQLMKKNN